MRYFLSVHLLTTQLSRGPLMVVPAQDVRFGRVLAVRERLAALFSRPRGRVGRPARLAVESLEDRLTPTAKPVPTLANFAPETPAAVARGSSSLAALAPGDLAPVAVSAQAVRYADGVAVVAGTDLASDGFGTAWGQTRTWSNAPAYASSSSNGNGWVSSGQPQLFQDTTAGTLVLVTAAAGAAVFDGQGTPDPDGNYASYTPRFTDLREVTYDAVGDTFVIDDGLGGRLSFYGFGATYPTAQAGTLKWASDAGGNLTEVVAHDAGGRIAEVQRAATVGGVTTTESYLYSYLAAPDPNAGLLAGVTLRRRVDAGTWGTVRAVTYTYYDGTTGNGNLGDLERATVADPLGSILGVSYYRYYTASSSTGYQHGMSYALTPQAYSQLLSAAGGTDAAVDTASDGVVASYAERAFEYDSSQRVSQVTVSGAGTFDYTYSASANPDGFNSWKNRTEVAYPDGATDTVYTNAYGQVLLSASEPVGGPLSADYYRYDAGSGPNDGGRLVLHADPTAVTGYDDTAADLVGYVAGNATYLSDTSGLVHTYSYASATTATGSTPGQVAGYLTSTTLRQGEVGDELSQEGWTYYHRTAGGATVTLVATATADWDENESGAWVVSYAVDWHTGTTQPAAITVTLPTVDAVTGDPGTATITTVFDLFGRLVWQKDASGYLAYAEYDVATGTAVKVIADVDTTQTTTFSGLPAGWATPVGGGAHAAASFAIDALGRVTGVTRSGGTFSAPTDQPPGLGAGGFNLYGLLSVRGSVSLDAFDRNLQEPGGNRARIMELQRQLGLLEDRRLGLQNNISGIENNIQEFLALLRDDPENTTLQNALSDARAMLAAARQELTGVNAEIEAVRQQIARARRGLAEDDADDGGIGGIEI